MKETNHDTLFRYWRLKERLHKRNHVFNRWLKIIILPLFMLLSLALLIPISILIFTFIPDASLVIGILYGIWMYIGIIWLNDYISNLTILTKYYYKKRKFKS